MPVLKKEYFYSAGQFLSLSPSPGMISSHVVLAFLTRFIGLDCTVVQKVLISISVCYEDSHKGKWYNLYSVPTSLGHCNYYKAECPNSLAYRMLLPMCSIALLFGLLQIIFCYILSL